MKRSILLLAALAALAFASFAGAQEFKAGTFDPPRDAPGFSLLGTHGKPLTLADYRGKVVVLGFGFTTCPKVCPTTLATLAAARKQLGEKAADVQIVWITVDPERDDAKRLGDYVRAFDPTFVGGTGPEADLVAVREQYGVMASKLERDGMPYSYSHSAFTFLIDREGRIRALMPYGHPADDFAHDLALLLDAR